MTFYESHIQDLVDGNQEVRSARENVEKAIRRLEDARTALTNVKLRVIAEAVKNLEKAAP